MNIKKQNEIIKNTDWHTKQTNKQRYIFQFFPVMWETHQLWNPFRLLRWVDIPTFCALVSITRFIFPKYQLDFQKILKNNFGDDYFVFWVGGVLFLSLLSKSTLIRLILHFDYFNLIVKSDMLIHNLFKVKCIVLNTSLCHTPDEAMSAAQVLFIRI